MVAGGLRVIRAVLDANVLLSGFLDATSPPGQLLLRWQARVFVLIVAGHILSEVERTLDEPYFRRRLTADQVGDNLRLLGQAELVVPRLEVRGVATHPEDDPVLATAEAGQAQYLVTGDRQLRRLGFFRGVTILTPREFLDLLDRQAEEV